jgi:hypothetical protein
MMTFGLAVRVSITSAEVREVENELEAERVRQLEVRVETTLVLFESDLGTHIEIHLQIPVAGILIWVQISMDSTVLSL